VALQETTLQEREESTKQSTDHLKTVVTELYHLAAAVIGVELGREELLLCAETVSLKDNLQG
jgi:hypothetical protein